MFKSVFFKLFHSFVPYIVGLRIILHSIDINTVKNIK